MPFSLEIEKFDNIIDTMIYDQKFKDFLVITTLNSFTSDEAAELKKMTGALIYERKKMIIGKRVK
jgi:hypothetical protein